MNPGLSIEQLLGALQRKAIPLPFEMGTFLVLEATEQVLTLEATGKSSGFCVVGPSEVWLSDQGEVAVDSEAHAPEQQACHALVVLLSDLLVRSAPGVPAMLLDIVEQGPSDGEWSLMRLRDDLEASLVPLNRSATRRVLSRLLREVRREDRGSAANAPDEGALDQDVDDLLGPDPAQSSRKKPAAAARPAAPRLRSEEDVTTEVELDEMLPHEPSPAKSARAERAAGQQRKGRAAALAREATSAAAPSHPRASAQASEELDQFEEAASGRGSGGMRIGIGLALIAATLGAAYVLFGQQASRSALGLTPQPEIAQPAAPPQPERPARPRVGELRVSSTPPRAQVLLLIGTAPVLVPKLPVGVAHEFVAMADGSAPSRAVVPTDANWQQEGSEQRYELALQLGDASGHHARDDLGASRMPQDVGSPKGLGSVRVITSPPGAKVYQLIGFTPDVRVENLEVTPQTELLVYLSGYGLQRVIVGESDWKQEPSGLVAELDVKLSPRGK